MTVRSWYNFSMNKKQGGFVTSLILATIVMLALSVSTYLYINKKPTHQLPVVCTMDAKLCPDGSYVARTGPRCEFTPCPQNDNKETNVAFGKPVAMRLNDSVVFSDGLLVTLKEINDSRCKPGLQCIWQGELSTLFNVNTDGSVKEIRLGTVNNNMVNAGAYSFFLESATESSVTIIVSVKLAPKDTSGVTGYIHMGPVCPVERYPADPNCADKPFADARVNIVAKGGTPSVGSFVSDTKGNFNANLSPGTYIVNVSSQTSSMLPRCEGKEVSVLANKFAALDISCDTGIR